MKSQVVRTGHIFGSILLMLFVFLGCNLTGGVATPPPAIQANTQVPPTSTPTPKPSRTPFPTRTPVPTPVPTQLPTPTVAPPIRIFDEALHPDWSLEFSDAGVDTRYNVEKYAGFYSLQVRPNSPNQTLFFSLRPTSAKAFRAGAIKAVTFQLFSGDRTIEPTDLEISIVGSKDVLFWDANDTSLAAGPITDSFLSGYDAVFPPKTLAELGISQPILPQSWVKVTYSIERLNPTITYDWLTGFYIENSSNLVAPFLIDDVRFIFNDS